MATLIIPTPLRKYTNQNRTFQAKGKNLSDAVDEFVEAYPEVKNNLLDDKGDLRSYIKLYIGDEEVRPNQTDTITLDDATEVSIVPAIAGGIFN